ncbi:hypothetical protein ACROYT_G008871 [Oculina patagonica]
MAAAAAASSACASVSSVYDVSCVSEEKTNGTRLARLLIDGGTHVLRTFLHSIHPPATLQHVLNNNLPKLQNLKSRRVLFDSQWEKLFPSSGDPPDSEAFDITLLHLLLREVCHLTAPATGWHKMPVDSDASPEANIIRIKCFRNELCHSVSTGIPKSEFEDKWNKISHSLVALGLDQQEINDLKTKTIDHDTERRVDEEVQKWKLDFEPRVQTLEEEVQQLKVHIQRPIKSEQTAPQKLTNCLPDEVPNVYGRSGETGEVVEAIQNGNKAVVLITGGPGFGKTTVAKVVAHELAQAENKPTVLFCSLISMKTFHEVATEMIHSSGTIQTQLPENPGQWLKDWSKQIQTQVTFILDNADGVLESDDRSSFLRTLGAVRMFSKQNVTFVITARKTFKDSDLQPQEVRLNPLSPEEAKYILESRINDQDVREKLSKTEKIAELCGGVPLALCIVGSLLSDYTIDKLIKYLEEDPLTVLEDDEASVAKAIKTSFDHLTEAEQDAFVLMSVFPGSFNSDDAEAIMEACLITGTPPVSILRSLKNRSLLEQPHSCKYQMHPLIYAFANEIARKRYPQLLDRANKKACVRFLSRFVDNANAYWSKDMCKESIESFNEDKHNFEYFLQEYVQARKNQDHEIMDACKTFLDDLPQKCTYLEMCVLPKFYVLILERLLQTFEPAIQPVHRVELLCILGKEIRKKGDQQKYKNLVKEARMVHSRNSDKFKTMALSEVYFRKSYARFFSEKNDPKENQKIKREIEIALKVSKEQLGDHPETTATLLSAGINAKRRKEYVEAHEKLMEALELSKKLLGKHFMTAQGKKNFDEAEGAFTKAEQVAERELEQDHTWKVLIKTELAFLYDKMGNLEKAKEVMLEGLSMGKRLNFPIALMGSKYKIREFIKLDPNTFPEEDFPCNFKW